MSTTNGKATSTTTVSTPKDGKNIIIRPARLSEGYLLGKIASRVYYDQPLSKFLEPYRDTYYSSYQRTFQERALVRMLNPNNISIVACEASSPDHVIGYAQFARFGDDVGARRQKESRASVFLTILDWLFWIWVKIAAVLLGTKSTDPEAVAKFLEMGEVERKLHWELPNRKNRWHAQSVAVQKEYRGKGIGKMLMREVIAKAEAENVPCGLEASALGRFLYTSVGFDTLAPFVFSLPGDEGGGNMCYFPKSWTEEEKGLKK